MTVAARRNDFAPAVHRLSLWTALNNLIVASPARRATLTTQPNSTTINNEREHLFSLFGCPELSQVIRAHLLDTAKSRDFIAMTDWPEPVQTFETSKEPPTAAKCPP